MIPQFEYAGFVWTSYAIFAIIIALTVLHDAHLIAFQPNINLAIAATIYLAVDATLNQVKNKKEN